MGFHFGIEDVQITCPHCQSTGNGLLSEEGGQSSYFCLGCLTRSPVTARDRRPSLLERLTRLALGKRPQ